LILFVDYYSSSDLQLCPPTAPISDFIVKAAFRIDDEFGAIGDIKFESKGELAKLTVRSVYIPAEHIPLENRKTKGSFFEALIWPQLTHMYKNKEVVSAFTSEGVTVFGEDQSSP
jgi:hypothetical protein